MTTSYHYRLLAVCFAVLCACANEERATPGTEPAVVPSVAGSPVPAAVRALQAAGLRVELAAAGPTPSPIPLDACDAGGVVSQDTPAGESAVRGSTVVLTVTSCADVMRPTP